MGATHAENPPDIHTSQNSPVVSNSVEYTRAPASVYNSKVRVYVELLVFLLYSERPMCYENENTVSLLSLLLTK
jgi:hypothetical protein